ncbi:hypothetical protein [Rhodoferax sp. UBA5149]|uniref:hypothetical protein n=1 Tax=Rhodoferax sp. UBA5149 TaxID=1947379 RepID=UPI0025EA1600|nr:hypothetical protein [Rhodoferax sp. UBA5149]
MHSAPAVSYPVGRSRFQGWLVGLTGLGGVLTGGFWQQATDLAGWRQWLFALTLLGTCAIAAQTWRRSPRGILHWDGQVWRWTGLDASVCGRVTVHLDLQFWLVLSLRMDAGARLWLWPERAADVVLWNALRRAVFSRGGSGQAQDAGVDALQVRR